MYRNISFFRFALALTVLAIPALILEGHNDRWAWRYVLLILATLILTQYQAVGALAAYISARVKEA